MQSEPTTSSEVTRDKLSGEHLFAKTFGSEGERREQQIGEGDTPKTYVMNLENMDQFSKG